MKQNTYTFVKSCLSSRPYGAGIRGEWISMLQQGEVLTVDCSKVESISYSFADELFGVLSLELGQAKLIELIKLANINEACLQTIAEAIQERSRVSVAA